MKDSTMQSISMYVMDGIEPGGFVRAVLENDLKGAIARADSENLRDIKDIVSHVYWNIPHQCQGSQKKVEEWIEAGGHNGLNPVEKAVQDGKP